MKNVLGCFAATKVNWLGSNVQYLLVFGKKELVFARIGGQFDDINAKSSMGLVLGGTVGALAVGKSAVKEEKARLKKAKTILELDKHEIIKLDRKNNFSKDYSEIDSVEIKKSNVGVNGARVGVLKINGKQSLNFDIPIGTEFKKAKSIVKKALASKIKK